MKMKARPYLAALLFGICFLSLFGGCAPSPSTPTQTQASKQQSATQKQVQTLFNQFTLVLKGGLGVTQFQNELPTLHSEKPSVAELNQYFQILHQFNPKSNPISWSRMTAEQFERYSKQSKALQQLPSEGFWLEIQSPEGTNKFPFFLQKSDEPGAPLTLSKNWINQSLKLYSYAQMYYQALLNQDQKGLDQLLSSITDSELRQKRIEGTLTYYQLLKQAYPDLLRTLKVTSWQADRMELEQPIPPSFLEMERSTTKVEQQNRRIFLDLLPNGELYVRDIIPTPWNSQRLTLFRNQHQLISLNQPVDTYTVQRILGKWEQAYFQPVSQESSSGMIEITYPDLTLHIQGTAETQSSYFTGTLTAISCSSPEYHLCNQEQVSMSAKDLQTLYPFLQDNDYSLSFLQARIHFTLSPDGKVSQILLVSPKDPLWKME